jgi:hypothetical protein
VGGQTKAVSDWLVPVSRRLRFVEKSGRTVDPSFDAIRDSTLAGRLTRVVLEVRGTLIDLENGDTVWCYIPELDVGVVAVGRARRTTKGKVTLITVTLDRTRGRVFAADPLPAATIRRWVPELRQGAVSLDMRPRALTVLDAWLLERGERDAELVSMLGAVPWRSVATRPAAKAKSPASHDIIGPIARLVRSQDFALGVAKPAGPEPRLIARRVKDVVIVDVCRIATGRGRAEAMEVIGPLLEARWRIERESRDLRLRASLWVGFSTRPHPDVVQFLEDTEVLVSWPQHAGVVELTDRSKQHWYQYLGVR